MTRRHVHLKCDRTFYLQPTIKIGWGSNNCPRERGFYFPFNRANPFKFAYYVLYLYTHLFIFLKFLAVLKRVIRFNPSALFVIWLRSPFISANVILLLLNSYPEIHGLLDLRSRSYRIVRECAPIVSGLASHTVTNCCQLWCLRFKTPSLQYFSQKPPF